MASVAYVVMEQGWQYNDNWNYPDNKTPHLVYLSEEQALAAVKQLTIKKFKEIFSNESVTSYSTGSFSRNLLWNIDDSKSLKKIFNKVFNQDGYVSSDADDKDIWVLAEKTTYAIQFYSVVPVKIAHPLSR